MDTDATLDFSLGNEPVDTVPQEAVVEPEPEEKPNPVVVTLGVYKAKKRKRPTKYTDEEVEELLQAFVEHVNNIIVSLNFIGAASRSMYSRGVRLSGDVRYAKLKESLIELQDLLDKVEGDALMLLGGVNVSRLLEHIATEWCGRQEIVYAPMTPQQRKQAHRLTILAHRIANNRTPVDYLGGYFHKILNYFKSKAFSWSTFLKEDNVAKWIDGDYERRAKGKDVGHIRYDRDKDVESFFTRYQSPEERLKSESRAAIARAFNNKPDGY